MINKSTLLGRLAKDPELREFANGGKVCKLRIITSRSWSDPKTGEFREKTEGHNVSIYVDKIAERIHEKCRKGDIVFVEGPMESRRWTDGEGRAQFLTEIAIRPRLGGIRRLPTSRASVASNEPPEGRVSGTEAEADLIPELPEDIFDDAFLDNGFGEFGSDLAGDEGDEGFPF